MGNTILILVRLGFCFIVLGNFACSPINSLNEKESSLNRSGESVSQMGTHDFESSAGKQTKSSWISKVYRLKKDGIRKMYFYDETNGYAINSVNTVYKTSNAAKSWKKVSFLANSIVNDIFFVTPMEGFVVAYKKGRDSTDDENESNILHTEDGGENWKILFSVKSTILEGIGFSSDGLGWVIGRRKIVNPERDSANFILFSVDGGQTWSDVSGNLNNVAKNERGYVSDYLTDLVFSDDGAVVVLSLRGKLWETRDKGVSWKLISFLDDEPPQTCICLVGKLKDGIFWVAGGTISTEGSWGMIAVLNNDLSWNRYRLNGYNFLDVKFLSNNEVIAVGSLVAPNNFGGANELNKGVILYSSDSGKNWSIVYESKTSDRFNSIAKLSLSKLFVAGNNGESVILEKSSENVRN